MGRFPYLSERAETHAEIKLPVYPDSEPFQKRCRKTGRTIYPVDPGRLLRRSLLYAPVPFRVNERRSKDQKLLEDGGQPWIKALILDHGVKNDPYIRTKIRELIRGRISRACKGDIYTEGNFQVIVSDPFGFMQHVCGLPVTGLLKPGMSYSNYWNERGVSQVDAMRSPLTDLSEHVVLTLQKDEETERWFRFCKQGDHPELLWQRDVSFCRQRF